MVLDSSKLAEDVTLGLDIGIGSIGWSLLRSLPDGKREIVQRMDKNGEVTYAMGARLIDLPENPKTKELLSKARREQRGMRRTIARRADRMRCIRGLLESNGFVGAKDISALHHNREKKQKDSWELREETLSRLLTDNEFSRVLLHMAKHRGFKSNSKKDKSGSDAETGKVLKATGALVKELEETGLPTVGALVASKTRQRNRAGIDGKAVYDHTMLRRLVEEEARIIFQKQRELGNVKASEKLESEYLKEAFLQRPMQSSSGLVGNCAFIEGEKRAPVFAPTAEKFRLAQRLTILRLHSHPAQGGDNSVRPLTSEEIQQVMALLGKQKGISYSGIRRVLKLPERVVFEILSYGKKDKKGKEENPENADVVRKGGSCGEGSHLLYKCLGEESYSHLLSVGEAGKKVLDLAVKIISDNDDIDEIRKGLQGLSLTPHEFEKIMQAAKDGIFGRFKGTMRLSLRAMEAIIPHMIDSVDYANGCELAGFDHTKMQEANWEDIRNHLVARLFSEVKRQINTVMYEFDLIPGTVHVELARDVGKGPDERNALSRGIAERTDEKKANRVKLAEALGRSTESITADELLRYELWLLQGGRCGYYMLWRNAGGAGSYAASHGAIGIEELTDGTSLQVDHILPYSRTSDNSFHNLCLCRTSANQAKGNRTPYEWIGQNNPQAWHEYEEWVKGCTSKGLRRRNCLMKNLDKDMEERFISRNLNDTRYISRIVLNWLESHYKKLEVPDVLGSEGKIRRRFFARPGAVTAFLRKHWGLEYLKKDNGGKRLGDSHHALDAFIIACCSERNLQDITKYFQAKDEGRRSGEIFAPMRHSRQELLDILNNILVSRAERMQSGALHEETLRSIRVELDKKTNKPVEMLYKRVFVNSLNEKNIQKIKDSHRCPEVITALGKWVAAGKPMDNPPTLPNGDIIRRVKLCEGPFTSGLTIKRGDATAQVDSETMSFTEVWQNKKDKKYYLVPVYNWQVAKGERPDEMISRGKSGWIKIDDNYEFCFSLQKNSYVLLKNKKGEIFEGYFIGSNRSTASIAIVLQNGAEESGIGVQSMVKLEKYRIDRLGQKHLVKSEQQIPIANEEIKEEAIIDKEAV